MFLILFNSKLKIIFKMCLREIYIMYLIIFFVVLTYAQNTSYVEFSSEGYESQIILKNKNNDNRIHLDLKDYMLSRGATMNEINAMIFMGAYLKVNAEIKKLSGKEDIESLDKLEYLKLEQERLSMKMNEAIEFSEQYSKRIRKNH